MTYCDILAAHTTILRSKVKESLKVMDAWIYSSLLLALVFLMVGLRARRNETTVVFPQEVQADLNSGPAVGSGAHISTSGPRYLDVERFFTTKPLPLGIYVLALIGAVYELESFNSVDVLFWAVELPTYLLAMIVVSPDTHLRWRFPYLWVLTSMLVWARLSTMTLSHPQEWVALSFGLLLLYCFVRALTGSIEEAKSSGMKGVATLLTAWGVTVQIAFVATLLIKPFLEQVLTSTMIGKPLLSFVAHIRATSPWSFLPPSLILLGLTLFVGIRFRSDDYESKKYINVLAMTRGPIVVKAVIHLVRLPTWLCILFGGILIYFIKQVAWSLREFIPTYFGRLLLISTSLILPLLLMVAAHSIVLTAVMRIHNYLTSGNPTWWEACRLFFYLHLLMLISFCLFVVSVIPLPLKVASVSVKEAWAMIRQARFTDGVLAAEALGKGCCLYGFVALAVPIASGFRGAFGPFSFIYTGFLSILLMLTYFQRTRQAASE